MNRQGFSLLEFSIVFIIIGFMAAGIFLGAEMIRGSAVRAQITQIDKMNSAVRAFHERYGGLPGDLQATIATQKLLGAGIPGGTGSGGDGSADGNGFLEKCSAVTSMGANNGYGCETALFWQHLAVAALTDGPFATSICAGEGTQTGNCGAAITMANVQNFLPMAKLANGSYVMVAADLTGNYFQIAGITTISAAGVYTLTNTLTPADTLALDTKWDDGMPQAGNVLATGNSACGTDGPGCAAAVGAGNCVVTLASQNIYNTTTAALADTRLCGLRISFY